MQAQSWIPVSERLPEQTGYYLVFWASEDYNNHQWGQFWYQDGWYEYNKIDDCIDDTKKDITHWMPIILPGQEEPEQGEFTKNILANLKQWGSVLSIQDDIRIRTIIAYLKEVCYRYDWLVKRNEELHAEIKQLVDGQVARKEAGS